MNVSLTPELERLVNEKVATGMYGSASEVIRAGLRLLRQMDADHDARLEALRRDVQIGILEADRREIWDGHAVFEQLRQKHAARAESATTRGKAARKRKAAG